MSRRHGTKKETIAVENSAGADFMVMSDEDFCRAMAYLLQLYRDEPPPDAQIYTCAGVIREQMSTQAWLPDTWASLLGSSDRATSEPAVAAEPPTTGRMSMEEAGDLYLVTVRRSNLVGARWGCAFEQSKMDWRGSRTRRGRSDRSRRRSAGRRHYDRPSGPRASTRRSIACSTRPLRLLFGRSARSTTRPTPMPSRPATGPSVKRLTSRLAMRHSRYGSPLAFLRYRLQGVSASR